MGVLDRVMFTLGALVFLGMAVSALVQWREDRHRSTPPHAVLPDAPARGSPLRNPRRRDRLLVGLPCPDGWVAPGQALRFTCRAQDLAANTATCQTTVRVPR